MKQYFELLGVWVFAWTNSPVSLVQEPSGDLGEHAGAVRGSAGAVRGGAVHG